MFENAKHAINYKIKLRKEKIDRLHLLAREISDLNKDIDRLSKIEKRQKLSKYLSEYGMQAEV